MPHETPEQEETDIPDRVPQATAEDSHGAEMILIPSQSYKGISATGLAVPPQTDANVERLARRMGVSKAEVFSRALALLGVAVDAKEQGKGVGVVDREGRLETEIVGY